MTLLSNLPWMRPYPLLHDLPITGICSDSRLIEPGDIYVALKGRQHAGLDFIFAAKERGALAVLSDTPSLEASLPTVFIPDLKERLGFITAECLAKPSQKLSIVGITGTNGKTSTAYLLCQLLEHLGSTAYIGTLGHGTLAHLQPGHLTTPDPISLQKTYQKFVTAGHKFLAMEVSSIALAEHRLNGTEFKSGLWTNFSRDHLDYHGTMSAYLSAKEQLFWQFDLSMAGINIQDPEGYKLVQHLASKRQDMACFGFGIDLDDAQIPDGLSGVINLKVLNKKAPFEFELITPWGRGHSQSPLLGQFNLYNLAASLTQALYLGVPLDSLLATLPKLKPPPGRMEVLELANAPRVVIDFAHTPDALAQVLSAIRSQTSGKIWTLVGCGGERDRGKRPLMAALAETYSDEVILTSDNPRDEPLSQILADMKQGLKNPDNVRIIEDRARAIQELIGLAGVQDMVLIAGKGHENYQWIGAHKKPFSDKEFASQALRLRQKMEALCKP